MFFPINLIVAFISALIYIFIAFNIPGKYKKSFRFYSIFINASFILFLTICFLFITVKIDNTNIYMNIY